MSGLIRRNKHKRAGSGPWRPVALPILTEADIPQRCWTNRREINGTRFRGCVRLASRRYLPLMPGDGNSKMGGARFTRGPFAGCTSFFAALVEGKNCPQGCMYRKLGLCGATNYRGLRFVVDDAFYRCARLQIGVELLENPTGIAVRLFVSGDFPDEQMVDFIAEMLAKHPKFHVWGHTHHRGHMWTLIDRRINGTYPERALIRASESEAPNVYRALGTRNFKQARAAGAAVCPATLTKGSGGLQLKKHGDTPLGGCSSCGLCMDRRVPVIAFPVMVNGLGYLEKNLAGPDAKVVGSIQKPWKKRAAG